VNSTHKACSEQPLDERLRGATLVAIMPYNIAYVLSCLALQNDLQLLLDELADFLSMISDFFYPQPGGVESHIYQLSSVGDLLDSASILRKNNANDQNQQQLTLIRN
jgi:hypothetical protein